MRGALGEWAEKRGGSAKPAVYRRSSPGWLTRMPVLRLQRAGGPRGRAAGGDMRLGPLSPDAVQDSPFRAWRASRLPSPAAVCAELGLTWRWTA